MSTSTTQAQREKQYQALLDTADASQTRLFEFIECIPDLVFQDAIMNALIARPNSPMTFQQHGQFRRTRSVDPAEPHDISLSDVQARQVADVLTEGNPDQFEKAVGDRFK